MEQLINNNEKSKKILTAEDLKKIKEQFDKEAIPDSEVTDEQRLAFYEAMKALRIAARDGNEIAGIIINSVYQ